MTIDDSELTDRRVSSHFVASSISTTTPVLLLIDVSRLYHRAFASWAEEHGIQVVACDLSTIADYTSDTVLCVYESHPARDLFEDAHALLREAPVKPLVVLAPKVTVTEAARLIQAGAIDVIRIPAAPDEVLARAAVRAKRIADLPNELDLIGESESMKRLRRELQAVSSLDSTILLTGETGTGKGIAARVLHHCSSRGGLAFVHADCSGLADSLIESELFGHERGAFTGAVARRVGRFEAAGRGTLFLDEIGELTVGLQAKLLRALQDRTFERVGSSQPRELSARIVVATNRNLDQEVNAGRFRKDLYYRLNVIRVEMPALRDLREDIPTLVKTLLPRIAGRLGLAVPIISKEIQRFVNDYNWPGNVRELTNFLERVVVHSHAGLLDNSSARRFTRNFVGRPTMSGAATRSLPWKNRENERQILSTELRIADGNISQAARNLGVSRSTLRYRIKLHNLLLVPNSD